MWMNSDIFTVAEECVPCIFARMGRGSHAKGRLQCRRKGGNATEQGGHGRTTGDRYTTFFVKQMHNTQSNSCVQVPNEY